VEDHRLAADGGQVVGLEEVLALLDAGEVPAGTIGLTFDDAFADVAEHALPVLQRLGFRATVFVTTGVTGGRLGFPWYPARQPAVLGWDDVVALDREGTMRFEAHTVSHPSLISLPEANASAEIRNSRFELEERLGRAVTAFAYPAGLFGEREMRLAREAGFAAATSCEPGVNTPETDPFALRRIQIDPRDRLVDVRAKVAGGHDRPLPLRSFYRRRRYGLGATAVVS
jgi:peptidoglycan/xylan/chitin deacetylase (PgdA/CDA1 family)